MGMNLLGLGFSFGAKDNGLASKQREVAGGFDSIASQVERMGSKTDKLIGLSKLSTFVQSLSLARLNDIAGGLDQLANGGQNLTTSLEATITASSKTARSMATNFGVAGKNMGKFTSQAVGMSIALNIGADKATEATYQQTLATKELASVGLKSASDLAKFAEVSGVSATDVTQIFKKAGQQFGLTGDQLKQLAGAALQSGTQIGDIGGQFKQMPAILDLVQRRAAVLGKKFDSKKMANFASQTLALSGAFYQMGESADSARELATAFAEKMVESGEDFGDMFAGTKTDLNEFLMGIGIASGDINKSFDAMKQGPGEFMTGMAEMVLKAKKSGHMSGEAMNMLRGQLSKTFGPKQAAVMMTFFEKVDEKQLEAMKSTSKATGDLGKFAKQGFSTGRTLAESFDLMKDSFVMNFRNIGRSAAVDFVNKTGQEFKRFNKQMEAVVKKGGPLAQLITKFSEIHQIGALALLPETLRPMAAVFGTMMKEAGPFIGLLGALGFRLNMLFSPFTLIVSAAAILGGWFLKLRLEGKNTGEALAIMGVKIYATAKKVLAAIKDLVSRLFTFLVEVDWGAVFMKIFSVLTDVVHTVGALLASVDWSKVATSLGKAMLAAFDVIVDSLGKAVTYIFNRVLDLFEYTASAEFGNTLIAIGNKIGEGIKYVYNKLFDLIEGALDFLGRIDLGKTVENVLNTALNVVKGLVEIILASLEVVFTRLPGILIKAAELILNAFLEIPSAISRVLSDAVPWVKDTMMRLTTIILDGIGALLAAIPGLVSKAIAAIPGIIARLGEMVKSAVDVVVGAILGIFDAIENWLSKKFPEAAGVFKVVFAAIKAIIYTVGQVIKFVVDAIVTMFQVLWKVVGGILKALWWLFDNLIITPLKWIWGLVKKIGEALAWLFGKIGSVFSAIGGFLSSVGSAIGGLVKKAYNAVTGIDKLAEATKRAQDASTAGAKTNAEFYKQFSKEAMAARVEEAQRAANKAVYERERARLDAIHLKDLEERKATFIKVQVTSENASAAMLRVSEAHAKGIKNNITLVDQQARAASLIAFPEMEKDLLDIAESFKKLDQEMMKATGDDKNRAAQSYEELSNKIIESHGVGARFFAEMRDLQMNEYTMRVDLQGKLSVGEQKSYQQSLDRIFSKYMIERQEAEKTINQLGKLYDKNSTNLALELQEQTKNMQIGSTEWVKTYEAYDIKRRNLEKKFTSDQAQINADINLINAKATAQKLVLERYMGVESLKIQQDLANGVLTIEADKFAAISALQQRFVAATAESLKAIHPMMRDAALRAQGELNRAYFEQLRELTTREFANAEERKKAFEALEQWKAGKLKEFTGVIIEQEKAIAAGGVAAVKGMEDQFGKFSDGVSKKANEASMKAGAAVGTIQKELGVSADEALNNLKNIAAIDPKKFAADLKVIKSTYVEFTKVAQEQAILMLQTAGKAFDEFNVRSIDNWKKAREGTKLFTKDEVKLFSDLTDTLVKKFGDAWTKILGFTATALEAIEKDTSRAISNLKLIEAAMRSAQTTKIDVAGSTVKQDVKMDISKDVLGNIFQATHHPEWYEQDFKMRVSEILMALNALLTALSAAPRGGQSTGPMASRGAAQQIKQGGIGIGDNRARPGGIK